MGQLVGKLDDGLEEVEAGEVGQFVPAGDHRHYPLEVGEHLHDSVVGGRLAGKGLPREDGQHFRHYLGVGDPFELPEVVERVVGDDLLDDLEALLGVHSQRDELDEVDHQILHPFELAERAVVDDDGRAEGQELPDEVVGQLGVQVVLDDRVAAVMPQDQLVLVVLQRRLEVLPLLSLDLPDHLTAHPLVEDEHQRGHEGVLTLIAHLLEV